MWSSEWYDDVIPGSGRRKRRASRARLRLEVLEDRLAPAVFTQPTIDVTGAEQYLVEQINHARADPAGEAARFGIALNEGVPAGSRIDPDTPKQPLAINAALAAVAQSQADYLPTTNFLGGVR